MAIVFSKPPVFRLLIQVEDAQGALHELHKSKEPYWTLDDVFNALSSKISKFESKHELRMQQEKAKIESRTLK